MRIVAEYDTAPRNEMGTVLRRERLYQVGGYCGNAAIGALRLMSVAFSPDGHTLAAAGHTDNSTINLWNVTDPDHPTAIGRPLTVETGFVAVLAFSPDGHTLAATTDDGVATLWDLNVESAISRICAGSSGALSRQQWSLYVPQPPYEPPCAST